MKRNTLILFILTLLFTITPGFSTKASCEFYEAPISLFPVKMFFADWLGFFDCRAMIRTLQAKTSGEGPAKLEEEKGRCGAMTEKMFDLFDCRQSSNNPICFFEETKSYFNSKENTEFLTELNNAAKKAQRQVPPATFNGWQWALKYFGGDKEKTLRSFALNFQDTDSLYLEVFKDKNSAAYDELASIIGKINNKDWKGFSMLPPGIEGGGVTSVSAKHFYPIAYAALKMRKAHPGSAMGPLLPVVFNNRYELYQDGQTLSSQRRKRLADYKTEKHHKMDFRDMYLGYQAYEMVINNVSKHQSFNDFMKSTNNYPQYLGELIRKGNPGF